MRSRRSSHGQPPRRFTSHAKVANLFSDSRATFCSFHGNSEREWNECRTHPREATMSRKAVWIAAGMILAIGVVAYLSYHQAPAVRDAAGTFTTVPSINRADMRYWLADGERGLWIQRGDSAWFYARFSVACHGLISTNSLVFDTGQSSNIDRTTMVVLPEGGRCKMQTFAPSAGPPKNRNDDVVPQPQAQ